MGHFMHQSRRNVGFQREHAKIVLERPKSGERKPNIARPLREIHRHSNATVLPPIRDATAAQPNQCIGRLPRVEFDQTLEEKSCDHANDFFWVNVQKPLQRWAMYSDIHRTQKLGLTRNRAHMFKRRSIRLKPKDDAQGAQDPKNSLAWAATDTSNDDTDINWRIRRYLFWKLQDKSNQSNLGYLMSRAYRRVLYEKISHKFEHEGFDRKRSSSEMASSTTLAAIAQLNEGLEEKRHSASAAVRPSFGDQSGDSMLSQSDSRQKRSTSLTFHIGPGGLQNASATTPMEASLQATMFTMFAPRRSTQEGEDGEDENFDDTEASRRINQRKGTCASPSLAHTMSSPRRKFFPKNSKEKNEDDGEDPIEEAEEEEEGGQSQEVGNVPEGGKSQEVGNVPTFEKAGEENFEGEVTAEDLKPHGENHSQDSQSRSAYSKHRKDSSSQDLGGLDLGPQGTASSPQVKQEASPISSSPVQPAREVDDESHDDAVSSTNDHGAGTQGSPQEAEEVNAISCESGDAEQGEARLDGEA